MAKFTLDDIRAAADAKYGSTDIETSKGEVSLVNPLRLPKAKRDALVAIQEQMSAEGADQEKVLADAIRLVASNATMAEALIEDVDGDLAMLVQIFASYSAGSQVGEA